MMEMMPSRLLPVLEERFDRALTAYNEAKRLDKRGGDVALLRAHVSELGELACVLNDKGEGGVNWFRKLALVD